jgi:tRNA (cytidine/uridine-2'-O-)-methyltransferase
MSIHLALYQPDIPQNTGAAIRMSACLGLSLDIIEPCGFLWDSRKIRQSAMDYYDQASIARHSSWNRFLEAYQGKQRIILLTTKTETNYTDFTFQKGDILLAGSESAGVPQNVHDIVDERLTIHMHGVARSMNVINASAMIVGEALRQINKDERQ